MILNMVKDKWKALFRQTDAGEKKELGRNIACFKSMGRR